MTRAGYYMPTNVEIPSWECAKGHSEPGTMTILGESVCLKCLIEFLKDGGVEIAIERRRNGKKP